MRSSFLRLTGVLLLALGLSGIATSYSATYAAGPQPVELAQAPSPNPMPGQVMTPVPGQAPSQSMPGQTPGQTPGQAPPGYPMPPSSQRHPGDYCCVHCRWNEKPCGNGCIPASQKICTAKTTCACSGKP